MDSLRTLHRLLMMAVVATLAGCAAPGAVIRGSLSLPGAPAAAARPGPDSRPPEVGSERTPSPLLPTGVRRGADDPAARPTAASESGSKPRTGSHPGEASKSLASARGRLRARHAAGRQDLAAREVTARSAGRSEWSDADAPPGAKPLDERSGVGEAVLYLEPGGTEPGKHRAPATGVQVNLVADGFEPRVVSIAPGDSVGFMNRDNRWHNAFSVSAARRFDLGSIAPGRSRSVRFEHPGAVRVFCKLHPDASGYVFVAPSRLFARPDGSGAFAFPPLPPGSYVVRGWHPRFGERRWRVELPPKGVVLALSF